MTLARLQQFTTLGLLLLAAAWATWAWQAGYPGWAAAGAALAIGGYALVLGIEFALLHRAHGADDPTPRARRRDLLLAWWGEVLSAPRVFCWRQPFFSQRWPDQLPASAQGRRGVLLVHGFVCNRGLWNPWLEKLTARGTPFVAVNLEPVFGGIDDYADIIDAAVRRLEACTGLPPVAVAHSMGGLALRGWWAKAGVGLGAGAARLHHAITIGTPHRGTWLARFAMSPNSRDMRQASPWLTTLLEREGRVHAVKYTCFYSHCDNIVFPPATATLPGADNRHLPGVAHVCMADRPEPWQELEHWLGA
jgi:triacylglycerol lipase